MNVLMIGLAVLCGLILCGTAISIFTVHRAHCLLQEMKTGGAHKSSRSDTANEVLRDRIDALAAQLHDLQNHPPVAPTPGMPKPGLNLNKRTQALRMHRRGETAEQICTALELPRQEVELLLKVHRIVLSSV